MMSYHGKARLTLAASVVCGAIELVGILIILSTVYSADPTSRLAGGIAAFGAAIAGIIAVAGHYYYKSRAKLDANAQQTSINTLNQLAEQQKPASTSGQRLAPRNKPR
jgi:hypothetical protein